MHDIKMMSTIKQQVEVERKNDQLHRILKKNLNLTFMLPKLVD